MNDRLINNQNLSDAEIAQAERLSALKRIAEGYEALKQAFPKHKEILGRVSGAITAKQYFPNRVDMFKSALPVELDAAAEAAKANQANREPVDETAKLDAEYTFEPTQQPATELDTDSIRARIDSIDPTNDLNLPLAA